MAAGVGNTRWLHQGANGLLQTSERDGAGVDRLPGKCNRYTLSYSRRRPYMAFSLNTIVYNGCISLAVCPLQPRHVRLFVEDHWPPGAAIACCPLLQPCKNEK